jgi:hypothetical protein
MISRPMILNYVFDFLSQVLYVQIVHFTLRNVYESYFAVFMTTYKCSVKCNLYLTFV